MKMAMLLACLYFYEEKRKTRLVILLTQHLSHIHSLLLEKMLGQSKIVILNDKYGQSFYMNSRINAKTQET